MSHKEKEWIDLYQLRQKLQPAILKAYGATHLNTYLLMNGAFENPDSPLWGRSHVHYWDIPRYLLPGKIGDLSYDDPTYPQMNPDEILGELQPVPDEIMYEIIRTIESHL